MSEPVVPMRDIEDTFRKAVRILRAEQFQLSIGGTANIHHLSDLANELENKLNALKVKAQGGEDGPSRFLSGELVAKPLRMWSKKGNIYYVPVTSDGTTGEEWIPRLKRRGIRLDKTIQSMLRSPDFKTTSGVETNIAILTLENSHEWSAEEIRALASRRRYTTPNAEVACLLREKLADSDLEAMKLYRLAIMHDPIQPNELKYPPQVLALYYHDDREVVDMRKFGLELGYPSLSCVNGNPTVGGYSPREYRFSPQGEKQLFSSGYAFVVSEPPG